MKTSRSTFTFLHIACLFGLIQALLFQSFSPVFAQQSPFLNLSVNTDSPPLYEIYEISFDLPVQYEDRDRFDPAVVSPRAVFTLPGGTQETMPGFFKQEEAPQWAIRYAPRVPGEYKVSLVLTDANGTQILPNALTFRTSPPRSSGFLEVDPNNPVRLRTSNGDGFVIIGVNTSWEDDIYNRTWDMGMVKTFDAMQTFNMNFGRVFGDALWTAYFIEASGTQNERGYARLYKGLGNYQLEAARDGDVIFQNAQDRDIRFSYVLFEHLAFAKGYQWERNAYNAANGGPCEVNTCFWSDPIAKQFTMRRMYYIFARYGSYTSFGFLEFWNEVDNGIHNMWTDATQQDVLDWHAEMDAYWKSLDFYRRPTTTSYAWRDHQWPEDFNQYQNTWPAMPYFDVVNQHRYPWQTGTVTVETWLDQIHWMQTSAGHPRPAYIGEYGIVGATATVRDPFGHYFHDGAWVPFFFTEAAGTNLIWQIDALFRPTSPTSDGYRAFGAFIRPEFGVLPSMKFFSPETVFANVQVGKYANQQRALLLFRDFDADPTRNNTRNQPTTQAFSYTLQGLTDGNYIVEFWHTMTGEVISSIGAKSLNQQMTFQLPPFQRALAVKVYAGQLPAPESSVTPLPQPENTLPAPTSQSLPETSAEKQPASTLYLLIFIAILIILFVLFWLYKKLRVHTIRN